MNQSARMNNSKSFEELFLDGIVFLIIIVFLAMIILPRIFKMSHEESVIAEQIDASTFNPKGYPHIKSADIEIKCPAVKDKSETQVECNVYYLWNASNTSNKTKASIPIGEYNYAFDIKHEKIENLYGFMSLYTGDNSGVNSLKLKIDNYTHKSNDISNWIKNRVSAAIKATANNPEVVEASEKEEIALSYL